MSPFRFQLAPRKSAAVQITSEGPPAAWIFLSLRSAKNPTERLSGAQNGQQASSVPESTVAVEDARGRNQSMGRPRESDMNASVRPSGEIADPPTLAPNMNRAPCGGAIEKATGSGAIAGLLKNQTRAAAITAAPAASTSVHGFLRVRRVASARGSRKAMLTSKARRHRLPGSLARQV